MKHDPIENDPQFKSVFENIDSEVEALLAKDGLTMRIVGMGWCHMFWPAKQRLLKEKYGIEWKTPGDMNPEVYFD